MKAQINGITVEGTPEEMLEYQSLVEMKTKKEQLQKFNIYVDYCHPNSGDAVATQIIKALKKLGK